MFPTEDRLTSTHAVDGDEVGVHDVTGARGLQNAESCMSGSLFAQKSGINLREH